MSFRLPLTGSPLRELFAVSDLLPYGEPGGLLKAPTFRQFYHSAVETLRAIGAAREVHGICLDAGGNLVLCRVGRRGAISKLWNFSV
jgi:hypothetical protein